MKKQIRITWLALILFIPLAGLEAADNKSFLNGKPFRYLEDSIVETDLEPIKQDISDINDAIDALQLQLKALAEKLVALRSDIDSNSNEIGAIYERVEEINDAIDALEQSKIVFSGIFTGGVEADADTQQAWVEFRSNATGPFTSIEIRNSLDGGVTTNASVVCSDPTYATLIAMALNSSKPSSFVCDTKTWNVGVCGGGGTSFELNARSNAEVCKSTESGIFYDAVVRPRIGSACWGGLDVKCSGPDQTLEVILTR